MRFVLSFQIMKFKFFAVCLLLLPLQVFAGEAREYTLPNGLKVLMVEDHKSPLAVFQIWYRAGSRNEHSGKTGLSHLMEHMAFKGTPKFGSKVLSRTVQRTGGSDNAFTTKDYTVYFQKLPSGKIGLSIEFESDRMLNLLLDEKEFLAERAVVMEERRLRYEDDPQSSLYEEVVSAAFRVHPYHFPVIGWMQDLQGMEKEDLLDYYGKHYSPDNAVVIIAGDINPDELIEEIKAGFGGLKPGLQGKAHVSEEPPQRGEKRVYLKREAELPYVVVAYHTPSIPHEDAYALDVLSTVLSGGKSSRLYKSLVYERKIALDAFADYSGLSSDPFLFILGGTPAPGRDPALLEQALYEEVARLKGALTDFELDKAKNQIEASFIMGQDSVFYQAQLLGMFEMTGGWRLRDSYIENIRKVSAGDIQRVINKYFGEENRTVGVLVPEKK